MTLPIRIPPVVERWDCRGCGRCCRTVLVSLDEEDVARLRSQRWDQHPEFRGRPVMVRQSWWRKGYRLATTRQNQCVFLTAEKRCRIHELYGEAAKPLLCRLFPFQLAPLDGYANATLRRHCPSAAADLGRTMEEHLPAIRELAEKRPSDPRPPLPPPLTPGHRGSWSDFLRATDAIERLLLDQRYPLVRRIVHGLLFCDLLQRCRLSRLSSPDLDELLAMLETSAVEEAGDFFSQRRRPNRTGAVLFRQTALEYVRLHPSFVIEQSWRERWRMIVLAAAFARGRGRVPTIHPSFPQNTFEALDEPLGQVKQATLRPLEAYFEAAAASRQYAVLTHGDWPLVESFRALALCHAVALWLVRLSSGSRPPEAEDMLGAIAAIDRGQNYPVLCGRRHRRRVNSLRRLGQLVPLVAWYAR